jgi:hypothetical protein
MSFCKLIILDEVNIKFEGLPVDVRRKVANALKFDDPKTKYLPSVRLGRWDGKKAFFNIGGSGYLNHLERILPILESCGVEIEEIIDHRQAIDINFSMVTSEFWGDACWPAGHRFAGEPIRLRDDQVEVINKFLENPQSLQEVSTGAGKCRTYDSLLAVRLGGNEEFNQYLKKFRETQNENGRIF